MQNESGHEGFVSGLRSEDYFERLQALSGLFEALTFDSTAMFEYARPITFLPLLIPLLELNSSGGGGWELEGEVAFQAARCLGFYLEASPEMTSEIVVKLGGPRHLVKWLDGSFEQIEFAETAIKTLALVVEEQRLALIGGDILAATVCVGEDDVSCSEDTFSVTRYGANSIVAILSIIDFLPSETQKIAMHMLVKGCTHLPPKYWHVLLESMPTISALIGSSSEVDSVVTVALGLHAECALQLCCVVIQSVSDPQILGNQLKDSLTSSPNTSGCTTNVDAIINEMSSHGLLDMALALMTPSQERHSASVEFDVISILTLFLQNSNKIRQRIAATPLLVHTTAFLEKLSKQQMECSKLMTSTMVLLDELLGIERKEDVYSLIEAGGNGSMVRVSDGNGVKLFEGKDGKGNITRLEYGTPVPLLATWVSDSGVPRHLVGSPTSPKRKSLEEKLPIGQDSGKKEEEEEETVEILGWVYGNAFKPIPSVNTTDLVASPTSLPQRLVGLICDCVKAASQKVEAVSVLALMLLSKSINLMHAPSRALKSEQFRMLDVVDRIGLILGDGGVITAHAPLTTLHAIKLIQSCLFAHNMEFRMNHGSICHCFERYGVWSRISQLPDILLNSSKYNAMLFSHVVQESSNLLDKVKFERSTLTVINPLTKCCERLMNALKTESVLDFDLKCSDEVEALLGELLAMSSVVTTHEWNSSQATRTLISYLSVNQSQQVPCSKRRRRMISFLRAATQQIRDSGITRFTATLSLLHHCISVETLVSNSCFELVLSEFMGGDPPAPSSCLSPQSSSSETKSRTAHRLIEFGASSSGLTHDTEKGVDTAKKEDDRKVDSGEHQIGLKAALTILNQPFQLVVKMSWIHMKRKGTQPRGGRLSHGIPMLMEPNTVVGCLIDYAITTAFDLGIGVREMGEHAKNEGESVSMGVSVMVVGVIIGKFRLVYTGGSVSHRPQLKCADDSSSVTVLHALHDAYCQASKRDTEKTVSIDRRKSSAPSSTLWEMTHMIDVKIDCGGRDQTLVSPKKSPKTSTEADLSCQIPGHDSVEAQSKEENSMCHCSDVKSDVIGNSQVTDILTLLRLMRTSADSYLEQYVETVSFETKEGIQSDLLPPQSAWINSCISERFITQLNDPLVLSCAWSPHNHDGALSEDATAVSKDQETRVEISSSLPDWMFKVTRLVPFCVSLEVRSRWMHSTMFGTSHALKTLHRFNRSELDMANKREKEEISPPNVPKLLVCVDRQLELGMVKAAMTAYRAIKHRASGGDTQTVHGERESGGEEWERGWQLEASFSGESGSGAGPTAEFFALLSRSFASMYTSDRSPLWRGQPTQSIDDSDGPIEQITRFFPWSLSDELQSEQEEESEQDVKWTACELMSCLGWMIMQCLQDGCLIDLPVASPLLLLLSNGNTSTHPLFSTDRDTNLGHLASIDPELAKQLKQLQDLALSFNTSQSVDMPDPIEEMNIDWTLPGRSDISLKVANDSRFLGCVLGEVVTSKCFALWMDRVLEVSLLADAQSMSLVNSFREGARLVGDPRMLSCFTPLELEGLLLGDNSGVDSARCPLGSDATAILKSIDCTHGYSHSSPAILVLVKVLAELTCKDQVAFIQFVTGTPRLPMGGLSFLEPRLTVVCKSQSSSSSSTHELPSASTCTNYLKLPDYGSLELMKERLLVAIYEGQGVFLLS